MFRSSFCFLSIYIFSHAVYFKCSLFLKKVVVYTIFFVDTVNFHKYIHRSAVAVANLELWEASLDKSQFHLRTIFAFGDIIPFIFLIYLYWCLLISAFYVAV